MLLSGATLAHMKKKILNLNYVCSEPYRLCVTFLGSKHKLKIYSIDLKTPQNKEKKKKKKLPQLVTKSGFTVHLNFSEVEAWICLYPPATVPDLLYLAAC